MPERLLLDTGVLIRDLPGVDVDDEVAVTSLSIAELEFGLSAAAARGDAMEVRRRATRLASVRQQFGEGLAFDGAAASAYGRITAAVLSRGRNPRSRSVDLLIAAVAVAMGAVLVTTQPDEFAGLEGLLDVRAA